MISSRHGGGRWREERRNLVSDAADLGQALERELVGRQRVEEWDELGIDEGACLRLVDSVSALNVFVQVVDSGSFAAAGRSLGISASAVGKSISRLEERVHARLFQRTSRSLRLTAEGERFSERCRRILAEIQDAEAELSEVEVAPRGLLRISMPIAGGRFHAVLADFQAANPAIDLEVSFTNRNVDLVREGFGAAVRSGDLEDSSLTARHLGTFRFLLVASPDYLARRGTPRHPRDLTRHDRLVLRLSTSGRGHPPGFKSAKHREEPALRTALIADTLNALIHFALAGHGLAYVPDTQISDELADGRLVPVLEKYVGEVIAAHVVWPPGRHTTPKLRAFVDYLAENLLPAR